MMRARADYAYVARFLWLAIAWSLTAGYLLYGLAYATGYTRATASKAFAVVEHFPGGMVGHGVVQLIIGSLLFWGIGPTIWRLPEKRSWLRYKALPAAFGYALITTGMFVSAPLVDGGIKNTGAIPWLIFFGLAIVCMMMRAPTRKEVIKHIALNRARMTRKAMGVEGGGDDS